MFQKTVLKREKKIITYRKGSKIGWDIFAEFYHSPSQAQPFHLKLFPCCPLDRI